MRAAHATILAVAFVLVAPACASTSGGGQPTPTPTPSAPASPSSSPVACTSSGPASPDWPDPSSAQPGHVVSATATGDTLTLNFTQGTPQFDVAPQSTTDFTADPSGQRVTLNGHAGVLITLRGFQMTAQGNLATITTSSLGPELVDIKKIGDYEGVLTIAVGLNAAGCAGATAGGSTLTFDFVAQPGAGTG